jgi:hypothetical protein
MTWTYNRKSADKNYDKWIKLGWQGIGNACDGFVDPERLIIETTHVGRYEGRLFKAMLTWIRNFHDLVNVQRLIHFVNDADLPVLGAAFDIAMQNGADHRLATVLKYCKPYENYQVLFKEGDEFGVYERNQKEFAREEFLKWGLYCTAVEFYNDAMNDKKQIIRDNPLLAIRALVGTNIRAEILFMLLNNVRIHISALAKKLGYAYSPVYKEAISLASSGFLCVEKYGRVKVLFMSEKFAKYLLLLPVD